MSLENGWFHVIEIQQFTAEQLNELFATARQMEEVAHQGGSQLLRGLIMAALFYEPSTRTRLSFESAMHQLGGSVITTENAREFSSAAKGETLEDTIRIISGYAHIIVIRHHETGAARRAATVASVPVINAGDGPGEHPTQALLDGYTILKELGRLEDLHVVMVGDLANGRTVRSLSKLLSLYDGVRITFVAHPVVTMRQDIKDFLNAREVAWSEEPNLLAAAEVADVLYVTRIQKERFGERIEDYRAACTAYRITPEVLSVMPAHAIVMHPLPRVDEISPEVDADPRAAYFRQAWNGAHVRMALLKHILLR